jgi:ribosomal protein L28
LLALKKDRDNEREKCEQLENGIAILVSGRNQEINELNKTIVSLENKLKAVEVSNEALKATNMHIYSDKYLKPNQCKISSSLNRSKHDQIDEHDQINYPSLNRPNEHDPTTYGCSVEANYYYY